MELGSRRCFLGYITRKMFSNILDPSILLSICRANIYVRLVMPSYLLFCCIYFNAEVLVLFIFVHVAARGATCIFTSKKFNTRIKSKLTRRYTFDLDKESTHGQPASCRAKPMKVDDGLEHIGRIRGLGGERLPAVSHALLPNVKKKLYFLPSERTR